MKKKTYLGSRRDTSRAHFAAAAIASLPFAVVVLAIHPDCRGYGEGDGGGERLWVWSWCDSIKEIKKNSE